MMTQPPSATSTPGAPRSLPTDLDAEQALNAVSDPSTPRRALQEIAAQHPELWLQIVNHPNAYPALLDWLDSVGDDQVRQAIEQCRAPDFGAITPDTDGQAQWDQQQPYDIESQTQPPITDHQGANKKLIILVVVLAVALVASVITVVALVTKPASHPGTALTTTAISSEPTQQPGGIGDTQPPPETSQPVPSVDDAAGYTTYTNTEFDFSIEYPSDFVDTRIEDTGNGKVFSSPDGAAVLQIWASNNINGATVASHASALAAQHTLVYSAHGTGWLIASWFDAKDRVVYQKEFVDTDMIYYMVFTYPHADKPIYDPVTVHLEKTFMRHGTR